MNGLDLDFSHRLEYIDTLKGIGILLVLLGHVSGLPSALHDIIYSFHMPLFFVISGFLFSGRPPVYSYVKKKFFRLIVPAWFMGLICGGPFFILLLLGKVESTEFLSRFLGTLGGYPSGDNNFHCSPIWFLFAVFWVDVLAVTLLRVIGEFWLVGLLVIGLVGGYLSQMFDGYFVFNINIAFTSIQYFIVGILLRRFNGFSSDALLLFGLVMFLVCYYLSPEVINLSENFIGGKWFVFTFIGAVGATMFSVYVSKKVDSKAIRWLGKNTIYIIGFDYYINSLSDFIVSSLGDSYWYVNFIVKLILMFILVKVLSKIYVVNEVISGRANLLGLNDVFRFRY